MDLIIPRGGEGLKDALEEVARCRSCTRRRATATSTSMRPPISRWRGGSPTTRRFSGRASATPPRPCSSTATSPRSSCRALLAELRDAGVELVGDERARAPPARRRIGEATRRGLGHRVPRAEDGGGRRRLARGRDRAREPPRQRPFRGDRDRLRRGGATVHRAASTRPASTSTPRPASPTASSSGWAPRSATRPRSCTRAARSACAS